MRQVVHAASIQGLAVRSGCQPSCHNPGSVLCRTVTNIEGVTIERNHPLTTPGAGIVTTPVYMRHQDGGEFVVALHGPLTPDDLPDKRLKGLRKSHPSLQVILCDEIVVRRNLPSTTSSIISRLQPS